MNPTVKVLASMFLILLALAIVENLDLSTQVWTNDLGTPIAGIEQGSPWKGIGIRGALRFWNGTVGTHEGGLQKWPMYWFIFIHVKVHGDYFFGGCLVIENWKEAYGWRQVGVRDAKANGMKIIIIDFEELRTICFEVDRALLIKLYLDPKKTWITPQEKQSALDYFNEIWQSNMTIEEILPNA